MSYLGENVKKYRKLNGLTIKELAYLCKSSVSSISQIETGKRDATFKTILKISEALGIDISKLVESPDKVTYEHHIEVSISFSDYNMLMGFSDRAKDSELISWSIVIDLSNNTIIDVLYFNSHTHLLSSEDFFSSVLVPYLSHQRFAVLMDSLDINNKYIEFRKKGLGWDDFQLILMNIHKKALNRQASSLNK
ncbi:helix-turn-helix domain-containing protein [Litchfieldia alkalitelluris]|uniref:helix-turn-helix domain-containing protein n=1 Tax=Litchfieldia alkalitelluris TaxID=304268 RepID=UPI0009983770|nr:helix-turn-helix transcriptional regulator [Litchfieldia alkalitelluris]